jgi:hypothetical protein
MLMESIDRPAYRNTIFLHLYILGSALLWLIVSKIFPIFVRKIDPYTQNLVYNNKKRNKTEPEGGEQRENTERKKPTGALSPSNLPLE